MSELPKLPANPSRRELRKAVLRLRLEVRRQQLRQESEQLLQPLRQARDLGLGFGQQLRGGASFWAAGGAAAAAALRLGRKRRLSRLLRLAVVLAPLLFKLRQPSRPTPKKDTEGDG